MIQDLIMMMKNFIMIIMMKTSLTALVTLSKKGKIQEFYIKIIGEIFKMMFQIIIFQIIEKIKVISTKIIKINTTKKLKT